jgi:hypothetical protein
MTNPSGTKACPVGSTCEACGTTTDLGACEADTTLGVLCATVCGQCFEHGELPPIGLGDAMGRILEHRAHTGQPPIEDEVPE